MPYELTPEIIAIGAVSFVVLIAIYCILELVNQKKICANVIKELSKYSKLAKQRKGQITILKDALEKATQGKYRHPEKGYFIGKDEFYACFGIQHED